MQRDLEAAYGDRFAAGGALGRPWSAAGRLGARSPAPGSHRGRPTPVPGRPRRRDVAERYYLGALDEACRCLDEGIAAPDDIDLAVTLGGGWETGPLTWDQGRAR